MSEENNNTACPSEQNQETLLTFPTRFPIKVMGKNTPDFRAAILAISREYIPTENLIALNEKPSKNGKFLSFTIIATFHNKPAIDAVYQALSDNPHVVMAL